MKKQQPNRDANQRLNVIEEHPGEVPSRYDESLLFGDELLYGDHVDQLNP